MAKSAVKRRVRRYSEAFKRQVVEEYEAGASLTWLQQKYDIGSRETIKQWVRRYGREGLHHEVVYVQRAEEREQLKRLQEKVRALEGVVAQLTLEKVRLEEELALYRELHGDEVVKKNAPS